MACSELVGGSLTGTAVDASVSSGDTKRTPEGSTDAEGVSAWLSSKLVACIHNEASGVYTPLNIGRPIKLLRNIQYSVQLLHHSMY